MTIPAFWQEPWTAALVNHLWQSTVVLGIAWLLSRALSKNSAQVRYCIWMAASLKFLLPFSLFVDAGAWVRSLIAAPSGSTPAAAVVIQQIAQPFPDLEFVNTLPPLSAHRADLMPALLTAVWLCGMAIVVARWAREWLQIRAVLRKAVRLELAASEVPAFSTNAQMEPGIFGIFCPVLLIPEGVLNRLTAAQLNVIVAHEMCHVRRRDNLMFALHMIVEAVFWFYPGVWWLGARLTEEREQACDEAVVRAHGSAETYAEGILSVCKYCLESPLACVSGISGADLKQRIAWIMTGHVARELDLCRRLLLGMTGFVALAAPLALGLLHPTQIRAQLLQASGSLPSFEVATINPTKPGAVHRDIRIRSGAGLIWLRNESVEDAIEYAYDVKSNKQLLQEPDWVRVEHFDIEAKVSEAQVRAMKGWPMEQRTRQYALMFQSLLADRFHLRVGFGMRTLPVYRLVVAKGGLNGSLIKPDAGERASMTVNSNDQSGEVTAIGTSMDEVANWLSRSSDTGDRVVVNATGLPGGYDFNLKWTPFSAQLVHSTLASDSGPPLFTALRELGLKLIPARAPVEVLVIDHIEQPTSN